MSRMNQSFGRINSRGCGIIMTTVAGCMQRVTIAGFGFGVDTRG